MHRHDTHLVAGDLHVALHFGAGVAQPGQETLKRRRLTPLVFERQIEKLVERIVGFRAEPRQDAAPRAAFTEEQRVECKRRLAPRRLCQLIEARRGFSEDLFLGRLPLEDGAQRRAAAVVRDLEQIVVGKAEQRTAQHGGQRKIVLRQ